MCLATGGDEAYTWVYPTIVKDDGSADSANEEFYVTLDRPTDFPVDKKVVIKVQDGRGESKEFEIELLPPGILVEKIYRVGNEGIAVGSTEEIYLQLNAIGELADINDIQARLIKGICNSEETCKNGKVFNVTQDSLVLESSETTGTGADAIHNLLYNLRVFIPYYAELTDGNYTYEIIIFDKYNQQTKAYLSAYIGVFANGDINGDQSIDILDIVKTVMYYLNPNQTPLQQELEAVDSDQNQQIDLVDVIKVIQDAMKE